MATVLNPGIVKARSPVKHSAYVVLSGSAGGALGSVFAGRAPLVSVEVIESVDNGMTAALNNDLFMNTFGYAPVNIVLSGLDMYADYCIGGAANIVGFFSAYNAHMNPTARVDVGIHAGNSTVTYRCVAVSLKRSAEGSSKQIGIGAYELKLIGVRI